MHRRLRYFDEWICEQHQQRNDQRVDRHGLNHREADKESSRNRAGRVGLPGDGIHRGGHRTALAERRPDSSE